MAIAHLGKRGAADLALTLLLLLSGQSAVFGADYEPKVCESAVEYRGAPVHPELAEATLDGLDQNLRGDLDPSLAAKLDEAVNWILTNTAAPGITAAVGLPGQGLWGTSRGLALATPRTPLSEPNYFHWASAGKTFTAMVVMQLVEQGRLGLDDRLAKWFPKFPNARAITIDHLLTHTSGIFSFNADLVFRREKGYHPPGELIRIAEKHGNAFCPGEQWSYCNTGYVMLARIVEAVEGRPFHEVIRARIIEPLGLKQTIALAPKQVLQGLAIGHVGGKPDRDFEPTTPFGAGNIASSARDMVLFWQALLSGRIVSKATVQQAFRRLYPMFGSKREFYGRGVMLYDFADDGAPHLWLGHSGGTPGIKAVIAYDPDTRAFVAVALNGDVSAEASANKLLKEVKQHQKRSHPTGR